MKKSTKKTIRNVSIIFALILIILLVYSLSTRQSILTGSQKTFTKVVSNKNDYLELKLYTESAGGNIYRCGKCQNSDSGCMSIENELYDKQPYDDKTGWASLGGVLDSKNEFIYNYIGKEVKIYKATYGDKDVNNLIGTAKLRLYKGRSFPAQELKKADLNDDYYSDWNIFVTFENIKTNGYVVCDPDPQGIEWGFINLKEEMTIYIKIIKDENVECLDDSWCNTGYECSSGNCIIETIPETNEDLQDAVEDVIYEINTQGNDVTEEEIENIINEVNQENNYQLTDEEKEFIKQTIQENLVKKNISDYAIYLIPLGILILIIYITIKLLGRKK